MLTRYTINAIIKSESVEKAQKLEVQVDLHTCGNKRDVKMENKTVNLKDAAYYLIQMFYKTGMKYSCTRTKIGKLLAIAAFKYAVHGMKLFDENIYRYDGCGVAINELKLLVERDVYIQPSYSDDKNTVITDSDIENNIDIPLQYMQYTSITMEVKNLLDDVFMCFGTYSASDLGKQINPIVNIEGITNNNEQVDLLKIKSLTLNKFIDILDDKEVILYIFNTDNGVTTNVSG